MYWKQKSIVHWLHEGDANTYFFHAIAKSEAAVASVETIVDKVGDTYHGTEDIHDAAVEFFHRLLTSENHIIDEGFLDFIPHLVLVGNNESLLCPFFVEEVQTAIFSIPLDAASRMDGFSAFFTNAWEIVKLDVLEAMNKLLVSAHMPIYLSHTAIVLIPKKR